MSPSAESVEKIATFLRSFADEEFPNELQFMVDCVPRLVEALGYERSHLFFEPLLDLESQYRADAIVASDRDANPWLLIETWNPHRKFGPKHWLKKEEQVRVYREIAKPERTLLLAPFKAIVWKNEHRHEFDFRSLSLEDAKEFLVLLESPGKLPPLHATPQRPLHDIATPEFTLSASDFEAALNALEDASTNQEKGDSFEDVAALLFGGLASARVKHRKLSTSSSEIDIIVEFRSAPGHETFAEFGRYALVECKNWAASVGAMHVRDFAGKLRKSKVRIGFLFSKNGVTGAHRGADALREINAMFDHEGLYIIVVSMQDLHALRAGVSFHEILDAKIEHLRFDL